MVAGALDDPADHDRLKLSAGTGGAESFTSDSRRPSFGGAVPPGKKWRAPDRTITLRTWRRGA